MNGITPTNALYNGNISAMKWKAGNETTERGYKLSYDNLNRLTAAAYGEGASLTSNLNRFNEAVTAYDKMGNILSLQRQGKLDSGYGVMDNLTYTYTGNRLTKVSDAVTPAITYANAFHFVDRANVANEYTYDANGNLTKDLNKNITSISYNSLNLPSVVTFADGNTISYGYDASGNKLSVAYTAGGNTVKTEYAGNKVYKNGTLSMILTEEGYITLSGATPTYHYYLKDHQGNNRVVLNQSGTVEQVNHYYPFGGLFGEGLQTSNQPYKYNGKELDHFQGVDTYDYGARHYDAALGRWFTVDPLAKKYTAWSPYTYCLNNPIIFIDPDGRKVVYANGVSKEFKAQFAEAVKHLNKHGAGDLLKKLNDHESVIYLAEGNERSFFSVSEMTIYWDPTMGMITNNDTEVSPTTVLNHEVDHAQQELYNPDQKEIDRNTPDKQYRNKEERRVITGSEQRTARKLGEIKDGEVTRTDHEGLGYKTTSPTTTQRVDEIIITAPISKKDEDKR